MVLGYGYKLGAGNFRICLVVLYRTLEASYLGGLEDLALQH